MHSKARQRITCRSRVPWKSSTTPGSRLHQQHLEIDSGDEKSPELWRLLLGPGDEGCGEQSQAGRQEFRQVQREAFALLTAACFQESLKTSRRLGELQDQLRKLSAMARSHGPWPPVRPLRKSMLSAPRLPPADDQVVQERGARQAPPPHSISKQTRSKRTAPAARNVSAAGTRPLPTCRWTPSRFLKARTIFLWSLCRSGAT